MQIKQHIMLKDDKRNIKVLLAARIYTSPNGFASFLMSVDLIDLCAQLCDSKPVLNSNTDKMKKCRVKRF